MHLRAVAYRMLGSASDAEDAVQASWLRVSRAEPSGAENLGGWFTTVVARICLDQLRTRREQREEPTVPDGAEPGEDAEPPEPEAVLTDAMGPALLVVLEALSPGERVAFVLDDLCDLPFDEIAPIVGRTPAAARRLARRARRRVEGAVVPDADRAEQRRVVDAFLAASREGNVDLLLALLDPDVVLRSDEATVRLGSAPETRGAAAVAGTFKGRARFARPALVDGAIGAIWAPGGTPRVAFTFTIVEGRILAIDLTADGNRLRQIDVLPLDAR